MKHGILLLVGCIFFITGKAQVTKADYERADSTIRFNRLVYQTSINTNWSEKGHDLWYSVRTRKGTEYKRVNPEKANIEAAFDHEKLCKELNKISGRDYQPYSLRLRNLKFSDDHDQMNFQLDGYNWQYTIRKNMLEKEDSVTGRDRKARRYWGNTEGRYDAEPVESPDGKYKAFIQEYNIWIEEISSGQKKQLSFNGSEGEFYSGHLRWSPDSKKIAVNRVRPHTPRYFYLIESSPKEQLQAKLHKKEYLKPGDAVPIHQPCLFHIEVSKQIPLNTTPFLEQFQISRMKWAGNSESFTFEFNKRGHQLYQVVRVDATSGKTDVVIEEKSKTFIDYSGKYFRFDLEGTNEIIWASERDGWNHLYLFDAISGEMKNQITSGEWVVRNVEYVDTTDRRIIFRGSGRNENEDPYFIHYYSISFDGTDLRDLTPEKSNHSARFSPDHRYFTDTYSTVTDPPVSVLRKTEDGSVILILEEGDITDLLAANWKFPEVFVSKGRDGKTDIWGNIYYPSNFDPEKQYPVIEYIYAGPQGAFTQKSFSPYNYSFTGLAELGFIIVQLDGMGTSYRSKAFHDVCYRNLKDAGFPDRKIWIRDAASTRPFMDTSRVGLFGVSAGGQNAAAGVLFHPDMYKAAAASCGCHDNRMDKIWWNEQFMGYPVGSHYAESSNVENAERLQGELLLIVGEMDDNVDPASTMQLANALIKAEKDFELVVIPGANHTLGGKYGEMKRRNFFVKSLYDQLPPRRNGTKDYE